MKEQHQQAFEAVVQHELNRPENRLLREANQWPRLRWDVVKERFGTSFEGTSSGAPANVTELFAQHGNRALSKRYTLYKRRFPRQPRQCRVQQKWTLADERSLLSVVRTNRSSVVVMRAGDPHVRWGARKGTYAESLQAQPRGTAV